MVIAFEDFELDEHTRQLRQGGLPVDVQPKVFDLLVFFAKNRDRLITRQELLNAVWDGVIVGDAAISRAVREVRRALADDGEAQRIVKTVHARGFRFVADLRETATANVPAVASPPARLAVVVSPADDFVGRAPALRQFESLIADVAAGTGRSTMIVGEAGIGKSRLLDRFARIAEDRGFSVHVARGSEADGVPALWPWEQIVRSVAARLDASQMTPEVRRAAADIGFLLGPDALRFGVAAEKADASDASARFRLQDGVIRFLGEAARVMPLAIFFDDVQLVDAGSLALLHHAASRLRVMQIALVASMREAIGPLQPGLTHAADALTRGGGRGPLTLRGFDANEVALFVERQTGEPPTADVCAALQQRTGGNPLFLAHVIDTMGVDEVAVQSVRVPRVLREAIDGSLARLSDNAVNVLLMASVVGAEFRLVVLAKSLGERTDDLLDAIGEAIEYHVVRRVQGRIDTFAFSHGLLRDTLYERLGLAERAHRHALVGDAIRSAHASALDPHVEELAHHYLRAASVGHAELAVTYAARAGDHAAARASYEHAATLYRAALDALPLAAESASRRGQLLVRLGSALGRAGRLDEAGTAFRDAADAEPQRSTPVLENVQALRDSFRHLVDRAPALTKRFYAILFDRHPQLRGLFGRRNTEAAQNQMFSDTLMAVVDRLEDAPWLRASLAELGARHVAYSVTVEMYPLVAACLLAALSEAAGDVWTPDVESAWRHALDSICAMMIDGAATAERRAG